MMTALPAAIAGPTLWATRLRGKLKGQMATTTPQGDAEGEAELSGPGGVGVQGDGFAVDAPGLIGGEADGLDGPCHLGRGPRR